MDRARSLAIAGVLGFIVGVFTFCAALLVIQLARGNNLDPAYILLTGALTGLGFVVIDLVTNE